jgi:FkbM family methyltransferase
MKRGMPITINNHGFRFLPKYYRYYPKDYECENFKFMKNHVKKGMTCIDIGAHFGLFSIFLAKYYQCEVYSFEPTPYTLQILTRHIAFNKVESYITIVPKAVSEKDGVLNFYIQDTKGAVSNSLIDYHHSEEHKTACQMNVTSIDSFSGGKRIDLIKIDAEGEEYQVLIGGNNTIEKSRPIILLSLHRAAMMGRGTTLAMIWEIIKKYRYTVFYNNEKYDKEAFCNQANMFDVTLLPDA